MKPHILLRTASALTLIHALLNSFAGLLSGTSSNPKEVAILDAMKALRFDAMGSMRTYWDFYFGFGLFLTVSLLGLSVQMWLLATLVKTHPAMARPFIGWLCLGFLVFAVLSSLYFFIAPIIIEVTIALLLALTYVSSQNDA